jgi:hypothetical protein
MTQITFKSVTEAFLELEVELNLFEKRIDGVYFWERIRFSVHHKILGNLDIIGQAQTPLELTLRNRAKSLWRSMKNIFIKNPYLAPKSEIFFLGSKIRKLGDDKKWWDIYCDPIIEKLERNYVCFELPYQNTHFMPAKTRRIWYLDFPFYLGAAQRKFNRVNVLLTERDIFFLNEIQKKIEAKFNIQIDLKELVKRDLLSRKSVFPIYQSLLKRVSPKIVILICSYGKETFVEACKTLGIPVVELQHGIINKYHLGYSFPGAIRIKRTFPDYLFVFGDFWKQVTEYPIEKEQIYSVGYPYLESEVKKYFTVKKQNQVLFLSQGTIGREMSKFASELSERENFPITIVYKLHPGEYNRWRSEYPWLINSKVKVVDNDQVPLYRLFAESKIQIGVYSTAIFEGLNFGLRTFLLDLPGVEYMDYLIEKHVGTMVTSVDDLIGKLQSGENSRIGMDFFFKPNSLDNIIKAIDDLLSGGKYLMQG